MKHEKIQTRMFASTLKKMSRSLKKTNQLFCIKPETKQTWKLNMTDTSLRLGPKKNSFLFKIKIIPIMGQQTDENKVYKQYYVCQC